MRINKRSLFVMFGLCLISSQSVFADNYKIDVSGMHAAVQFRIKHLGYSWLNGQFNRFSGEFNFDENAPNDAQVNVDIDATTIDTNHAERDKHLRSDDFLAVDDFPSAKFVSTSAQLDVDGNGTLEGELTLKGVTKPVTLILTGVGAGNDPWGGYRRGFEGTTEIGLKDFGITTDLGPASQTVELRFSIEGIRQ